MTATVAISPEEQASLAELAMTDALTGLSNTRHFKETAENALATPDVDLAIFLLDLDRFKSVNDTLGHPTGDQLLRKVSDRLRATLRPGDLLARLGGDEFAILLQPAGKLEIREQIAMRIIEMLSRPFLIDGNQVNIGSSVGIAVAGPDATYEQLIRQADLALYAAKETGGGAHRHFEQTLADEADARRALELELRKALTLRQFEVHYRPRLDVETGRLISLRAELRWRHPQRGLLEAHAFMPLATQIGLASRIERWLLETACREAAMLPDSLPLSVGVAEAQFSSDGMLLESVKYALLAAKLQTSRLEIEITEHLLLTQEEQALQVLFALRALGVRLVMNDFGLGYASLTRLTSFPFDSINLAPLLAESGSAANRAMVQAVAAVGASLGVVTTLEGIGSLEQLTALRRDGSMALQGSHLQPALAPPDLRSLLQQLGTIQTS